MDKEQLLSSGLLEQYVLGLTTEEENQLVEAIAAEHEDVRRELALLRQAMNHYAHQHSGQAMPESAAQLQKSNTGLRKLSGRVLWPLATGFTLLWGAYGAMKTDIQHQELREWEGKYGVLQKECEAHQHSIQTQADLASFIQHRHTSKIILNGIAMCEGHYAVAYWNPAAEKCYLDMGSLPPAPKGKSYQVWGDVDGKMVSAGIVKCPSRNPLQEIKFIRKASSLNITLEPESGSKEPTVDLLQANGLVASI